MSAKSGVALLTLQSALIVAPLGVRVPSGGTISAGGCVGVTGVPSGLFTYCGVVGATGFVHVSCHGFTSFGHNIDGFLEPSGII